MLLSVGIAALQALDLLADGTRAGPPAKRETVPILP
jgi:hypothetical protein